MSKIEAKAQERGNGWTVVVVVSDNGTRTTHEVAVTRAYFDKLTGGNGTPEDLVKKSFEFLLQREPKESILGTFELPVISRYFPEYEKTICRKS